MGLHCKLWWAASIALSLLILLTSCSGDDAPAAEDLPPDAARGLEVAQRFNCTGCHTSDGGDSVGPTWQALYGSEVTLENGSTVTADEAYLGRAIEDPTAEVVDGFRSTMPTQDLTDEQVDDVIAYIRELAG